MFIHGRLPLLLLALVVAGCTSAPPSGGLGGNGGQWEVTLAGSGASDKNVESGVASASGSLGYLLGDHFELAVRQSVGFADVPGSGSTTDASTRGAADLILFSGPFRPVLGASFGRVYGDTVRETWVAGPEAGFKLYIKRDVFLELLAEYQFFFEHGDQANDAFDDGSFVYSLGFGVNF
jgi:hypothetical protein